MQRGTVLNVAIDNALAVFELLIMLIYSQHLHPVILEICFKIILGGPMGSTNKIRLVVS